MSSSTGAGPPDVLFFPNGRHDVYLNIVHTLGPWQGILHRHAAMLEVMRVLAGFESSWTWTDGLDLDKLKHGIAPTAANAEAGAWQVSADSMGNAQELKDFMQSRVGSLDPLAFQRAMKRNHALAMEYIVRLLRVTVRHNGPVNRREINTWLRRDAVEEFLDWLSPPKRAQDDIDVPQLGGRWR